VVFTFDRVLALKSVKCAPVLKESIDLTVPHSALFLCMCHTTCSVTIALPRSLSQ
jgi:hypothetical protein